MSNYHRVNIYFSQDDHARAKKMQSVRGAKSLSAYLLQLVAADEVEHARYLNNSDELIEVQNASDRLAEEINGLRYVMSCAQRNDDEELEDHARMQIRLLEAKREAAVNRISSLRSDGARIERIRNTATEKLSRRKSAEVNDKDMAG